MEIEGEKRWRLPRQGGGRLPQGKKTVESTALGPAPPLLLVTSAPQGFAVPADKPGGEVGKNIMVLVTAPPFKPYWYLLNPGVKWSYLENQDPCPTRDTARHQHIGRSKHSHLESSHRDTLILPAPHPRHSASTRDWMGGPATSPRSSIQRH